VTHYMPEIAQKL